MKASIQRCVPIAAILLCVPTAIVANTLDFAANATLTPLPRVVAVTTFASPLSGQVFETVNEQTISAIPCNLLVGCPLGEFTVNLPTVALPDGQALQSATLEVFLTENLNQTNTTSTTAIDPALPYTTSATGTTFLINDATFNTANGILIAEGNAPLGVQTDYTSEILTALHGGTFLAPITISDSFSYFFEGGTSIDPEGINSVTTYVSDFGGHGANLYATAVLELTTTPIPETSSVGLLGVGLFALSICLKFLGTRQRVNRR